MDAIKNDSTDCTNDFDFLCLTKSYNNHKEWKYTVYVSNLNNNLRTGVYLSLPLLMLGITIQMNR